MRTVAVLHRVLWLRPHGGTVEGRRGQIPEMLRVELKEFAKCAVQEVKESRQRGLQVSA